MHSSLISNIFWFEHFAGQFKDEPGDDSSNSSPFKKTFSSRKKKSRKEYSPVERQILVDYYMKDPNPNHAEREKLGMFHSSLTRK